MSTVLQFLQIILQVARQFLVTLITSRPQHELDYVSEILPIRAILSHDDELL